jgi:release factor glutamine methyltransferase
MRAFDKLKEAAGVLKRYGIENAERDAEIILIHCLETDRSTFFRDNPIICKEELGKIDDSLRRRSKREPLQYILGYVDFYGLKIKVGKGILIPRPETELLAEVAIKVIKSQLSNPLIPTSNPPSPPFSKGGMGGFEKGGQEGGKGGMGGFAKEGQRGITDSSLFLLDLCTGSGCLALALARKFPDAQVYGTDISDVAIQYAKENARLNCISNVIFLQGNLFEPLEKLFTLHSSLFTFNLIVSNPPYVKRNDIKNLQPEIKDWEPIDALDGGEDGLDYYRAVIPKAKDYLKDGGNLILEIGIGQADAVRKSAEDAGFKDITFRKDYAGIERIMIARNILR